MPGPTASFAVLHRPDGSVEYSHTGYALIGSVNGPIEAQRRDELPEEAAIEVNVRPAAGVGSTRERQLESIVHSTLKTVVLTRQFPRNLVQVVLQVIASPEDSAGQTTNTGSWLSALPLLPALLQTANLALISASIPLSTTFTATAVAISSTGATTLDPTPKELELANSFHVFAFTGRGDLLVCESEGSFDMTQWDDAYALAERTCCSEDVLGRKGAMITEINDGGDSHLHEALKQTIVEKVEEELRWKQAT